MRLNYVELRTAIHNSRKLNPVVVVVRSEKRAKERLSLLFPVVAASPTSAATENLNMISRAKRHFLIELNWIIYFPANLILALYFRPTADWPPVHPPVLV